MVMNFSSIRHMLNLIVTTKIHLKKKKMKINYQKGSSHSIYFIGPDFPPVKKNNLLLSIFLSSQFVLVLLKFVGFKFLLPSQIFVA